jgi:hypothetical protein
MGNRLELAITHPIDSWIWQLVWQLQVLRDRSSYKVTIHNTYIVRLGASAYQ